MNRRERFFGAVEGGTVDRVPVTVWMHFVTPYLSGEVSAKRHCQFIKQYNWDLAKAVSDYRFPLPNGATGINTIGDFKRIKKVPMSHPTYTEQINLLKGMRSELGDEWPVIDTTFDPIQQVLRHAGFSAIQLILDNFASAKPMIEAATETVINYVRELKINGVDGVFYSTRAAATEACSYGFTQEAFEELLRPYDIAILEEMKGLVRMLHVCKSNLDLNRIKSYPHEVLSWADKDPTCPTIAEVREISDKCLMGGIDQSNVIEQSIAEIQRDINSAISVTKSKNFILSPGCTIGSNVPEHVLNTIASFTKLHPN